MIKVSFSVITTSSECRELTGFVASLPKVGELVARENVDKSFYYRCLAIIPLIFTKEECDDDRSEFNEFEIICMVEDFPLTELFQVNQKQFRSPQGEELNRG